MRCPHCDYLLDDEESPPHMIFCSECGGKLDELSPPDSFPSTNSDNANFLSVEINVNRFYMDGMAGILEFRLHNQSKHRTKGRFYIGSKILGDHSFALNIGQNQNLTERIQISPISGGEALVNVMAEYSDGRYRYQYRGQFDVKVLAQNTMPTSITIDQSIRAGDSAKVGFGLMQENGRADLSGLYQSPNDLLSRSYEPCWIPVILHEESRCRIQLDVIGEIGPAASGIVIPITLQQEEASSQQWIHLLAEPCIHLGRRRDNHIVLRCLPRNEKNDVSSSYISKKHLTFRLHEGGLSIEDESQNGLVVDDDRIHGQEAFHLDRPVTLNVADALKLRVTPIWGDDEGQFDAIPLGDIDGMWRMAGLNNLAALQIDRINNLPGRERFFVVFRWIDLEDGQLRIVRRGGRWWLVRTGTSGTLQVGDLELQAGQAIVLQTNQEIQIAHTRIRIAEYGQWLL